MTGKIVLRSVSLCANGCVTGIAGFRGFADNIIEKEVVLGPVSDGGDNLGGTVGALVDGSTGSESSGVRLAGVADETVVGSGSRHHGVDVDPDRIG